LTPSPDETIPTQTTTTTSVVTYRCQTESLAEQALRLGLNTLFLLIMIVGVMLALKYLIFRDKNLSD
jgi:ABC-type phosphate transport system permease subunit